MRETGHNFKIKLSRTFFVLILVSLTLAVIVGAAQALASLQLKYVAPTGAVNISNPTVKVSVKFPKRVAAAQLSLNGGPTSSCTISGSTISCPRSGLADGNYQAVVSVDDSKDGTISVSGNFQVDTVNPLVSGVLPTGFINTSSTTISVSYSDEGSGINTDAVTVNLDGSVLSGCQVTETSASCSVTGLAQGNHYISGNVSDNAGNKTAYSGSFAVETPADTMPPVVTYTGPTGTITDHSPTVTATATDNVGVTAAHLNLNGGPDTNCSVSPSGGASVSVSCPTADLADGSYSAQITAADNAGNTASANGSFAVSTSTEVPRTVVSLTFDDGRASQPNAGAILAAHGVHGTFFVNSIQLGTSSYYMSLDGVRNLASAGNEIGGHTLNHYDLTKQSTSTVATEVCQDQQNLQGWGFPAVSFAYPYGVTNATVESIVSSCKERGYNIVNNYKSARIVGDLQCSGCDEAESIPPADPYAVRTAGNSPTSSTTLDQLKTMVTRAESTGGWLVIPFHSVCSAPPTAPVPGNAGDCKDNYSITYSNLDQFVGWLTSRSSLGTVVKMVSEVMGMPAPPPPPPLPPPPPPPGENLVQNASLELDANGDNKPDGFLLGGYGTNTYSYTRTTDSHSGAYAEQLIITSLSSGDRKVVTAQDNSSYAMVATPGTTYQTSVWFKSDKPIRLAAYYHDAAGWHWWAESPFRGPATDWTQIVWNTPPMPAGADLWSFGPALDSVGTMTVDDFAASIL